MKKIWLMGGFGNVLFQILAFNVISKNNDQVFYVKILTEKNLITKFLGWTIHERLYEDLINKYKIHEIGLLKSSIIILISFLSKKFNRFEMTQDNVSDLLMDTYPNLPKAELDDILEKYNDDVDRYKPTRVEV